MSRSRTTRGFVIYDEFTDSYNNTIDIQESSHIDGDRCWIFCRDSTNQPQISAPHLNVEQARRVRDALDVFISEHE